MFVGDIVTDNLSVAQDVIADELGVFIYKSISDLNITIVEPRDTNFMGKTFWVKYLHLLACTCQKLFL